MQNNFLKKVDNYIEKKGLISRGDRLVLGVSGGADSVCLLLTMCALKEKYELELFVVCVNHGLREEAKEEASYVEKLCKERGIKFFLFEEDVNKLSRELSIGTEEAGRKLRYDAFNEIFEKEGLTKICVAHNKNDVAETLLFNLFRGTGIKGLSSIPEKRDNIIRPLLCVERKEIEGFLQAEGVTYYTDASNLSLDYTRNKIRNKILPYAVTDINKETVSNISNAASQLSQINDFLSESVEKEYKKVLINRKHGTLVYNKKVFLNEHIYIKKALVKKAIDELAPNNKDITHVHIEAVLDIVNKDGSKRVKLPYDIEVIASYEEISFFRNKEENSLEAEIVVPGKETSYGRYKISSCVEEYCATYDYSRKQYTKCLDYDKIIGCLKVRKRETKDFLVVNAKGQKKKLKDYFIDEKIPAHIRDEIPVLAVGNEVVWVVGYRISEAVKITNETKRVLKIIVSKED